MKNQELIKCIETVKSLRDPEHGCPWDLKQTHHSLLKYLLEESYEFIEATENNDFPHMEEELGDILLQVLLHARIAEEKKHFSLESCAQKLSEKLIRRHPHVFQEKNKMTYEEVLENWNKIKEEERIKKKDNLKYALHTKILHAPALESSYGIGKFTESIKFDWAEPLEVISKVEEEWQEVLAELAKKNIEKERK